MLANCFKGKAQAVGRAYDVVLGSASSPGVSRYNSTLAQRGQGEVQNRWGLRSASSLRSVRLGVWDEQDVDLVGNE